MNNLLPNNQSENIKKVEKYIFKYVNELKIHFNLSNKQLVRILHNLANKLKKDYNKRAFPKLIFNLFKKK